MSDKWWQDRKTWRERRTTLGRLRPGETFRIVGIPGEYELIKLGAGSALIRDRRRVVVESFDADGETVDGFSRAGKTTRISLATTVEIIEDGPESVDPGGDKVVCTGCGDEIAKETARYGDHADTYSGTTWHCDACWSICQDVDPGGDLERERER